MDLSKNTTKNFLIKDLKSPYTHTNTLTYVCVDFKLLLC